MNLPERDNIILLVTILTIVVFLPLSCLELDVTNDIDLLDTDFFANEEDFVRFSSHAYLPLRSLVGSIGYFSLQEISTDEACVPTRGMDWNEDGHWRRLHNHTWQANDRSIEIAWQSLYQGVQSCNRVLENLESIVADQKQTYIAEIKSLRALYYTWILDLFGSAPLVTEFDMEMHVEQVSSKVLFSFIEQEFLDHIPDLAEAGTTTYGRIHQEAAQTALARMYLNGQRYTAEVYWPQVIALCDEIINSSKYELEDDFFANFSTTNENSKEIILAIPFDRWSAPGFNLTQMTLHFASQQTYQLESQPWNGWCTLEDFYRSFDSTDYRLKHPDGRSSFITGPQFDLEGNPLLEDTSSNPFYPLDPEGLWLEYTPFVHSLDSAYSQDGARVGKYEIALGAPINQDNDFPIFRYAMVLMMKAEALWNLGQTDAALELVNQVRSRSNLDPLTRLDQDILSMELGKEFFMEGHRRTDQIRLQSFFDSWWEKPASEPCRTFFPIPQEQLEAGSNLDQNPCY